jgi:hypothetical protein
MYCTSSNSVLQQKSILTVQIRSVTAHDLEFQHPQNFKFIKDKDVNQKEELKLRPETNI